MVFKHMKEDVLRIAKMIDRSAGEPKMFSEPVYVEFSADYAPLAGLNTRWTKSRIRRPPFLRFAMRCKAFIGTLDSISSR